MMRQPKPYRRGQTGSWYVQLGKKQILLGRDKEEAFRKYHELMADRGRATVTYRTVAPLLDDYLAWLKKNRSEATYDKARRYLSCFCQHIGNGFQISRLEPSLVMLWIEAWADERPSTATQHSLISLVQRAFNWAVKRGHLARSPVAVIADKPSPCRRETVYSPAQWQEIRAAVKDEAFGDLLDFMWETGCRPLEARTVCAHHVDLANKMAIFPRSEAKGERNERVIFLTSKALEICQRQIPLHPEGPLILNTKGKPWTKDSINCRFRRLSKKLGQPMCAYGIRHSYATEGLKQGMDSLTLAQIMGYSDVSMLAKHYAHLARNPKYLSEQAEKLRA